MLSAAIEVQQPHTKTKTAKALNNLTVITITT
jgi:hypothetical protein